MAGPLSVAMSALGHAISGILQGMRKIPLLGSIEPQKHEPKTCWDNHKPASRKLNIGIDEMNDVLSVINLAVYAGCVVLAWRVMLRETAPPINKVTVVVAPPEEGSKDVRRGLKGIRGLKHLRSIRV